MATLMQLRKIALALPGVEERGPRVSFELAGKGKNLAWSWLERIEPKKARVENTKVFAFRVANAEEKALVLGSDPELFVDDPHYNGYPAVIVRLADVSVAQLRVLAARAHEAVTKSRSSRTSRAARPPRPSAKPRPPKPAARAKTAKR